MRFLSCILQFIKKMKCYQCLLLFHKWYKFPNYVDLFSKLLSMVVTVVNNTNHDLQKKLNKVQNKSCLNPWLIIIETVVLYQNVLTQLVQFQDLRDETETATLQIYCFLSIGYRAIDWISILSFLESVSHNHSQSQRWNLLVITFLPPLISRKKSIL